ncbi:unnamed protein product, partial [Meganyctiphanes norvegica]
GTWLWQTGEPLGDNFPWKTDKPNNFQGRNKDCLEIRSDQNRYNDRECHLKQRYICEEWCPPPYILRGTKCFFVSEDKNNLLSWDEAHQTCLRMGGVLAQPQDMVDFVNYISESYPNSSNSTIWLGATDREVEQEWHWLSGEPVPPAMWKPWPQNQPSGDGNCMEIHW